MTRKFLALGAIVCLAFAVACSAKTAEVGEDGGDNDASATWAEPAPDSSTTDPTNPDASAGYGDDGGITTSHDASASDDASSGHDSSCPPPPPPPPPCGCGAPDASADDDASSEPVPVDPDPAP